MAKILIAEDDGDIIEILRLYLENYRYLISYLVFLIRFIVLFRK